MRGAYYNNLQISSANKILSQNRAHMYSINPIWPPLATIVTCSCTLTSALYLLCLSAFSPFLLSRVFIKTLQIWINQNQVGKGPTKPKTSKQRNQKKQKTSRTQNQVEIKPTKQRNQKHQNQQGFHPAKSQTKPRPQTRTRTGSMETKAKLDH